MRINSPSDYYACLEALAAIEKVWDDKPDPTDNAEVDAAFPREAEYSEIHRAVRGYLRGLDSDETRELKSLAPNTEMAQLHQNHVDQLDREHLEALARLSGARPQTEAELKSLALSGYLLKDQFNQNRKRRIKEQGRIVQCQMCTIYFHSVDTERIKPYGSTTYGRFCKTCGEKVKAAKAIYQGMSRGRRNKA